MRKEGEVGKREDDDSGAGRAEERQGIWWCFPAGWDLQCCPSS